MPRFRWADDSPPPIVSAVLIAANVALGIVYVTSALRGSRQLSFTGGTALRAPA